MRTTRFLLFAGAVATFFAVAGGALGRFDAELLLALREPGNLADPIGSPRIEAAVRDLTALGGTAVLSLLVAFALVHLSILRERAAALFLFLSTVGSSIASSLLKVAYARPRPEVVPHLMSESSMSFPSGHAMVSTVVYLIIGAMLARRAERRWQRVFYVAAAVGVIFLIGVSRVYLGVHYPSDVLAGCSAGLAWVVLCDAIARRNWSPTSGL